MNARISILIAALALAAACSNTSGPLDPPSGPPSPDVVTPTPDTTTPTPDTITEPTGDNKLWFAVQSGVDGQPCTTSCTLKAETGQNMTLPVYYRDGNGSGIESGTLIFKVNTVPAVATLNQEIVTTNAQGIGQAILAVAATADGVAQVTVTAMNDPKAGALTFNIQLGELTLDALRVTVNYAGSTQTSFEARLFLQAAGTQTPVCADVDPANINAPVSVINKKSGLTDQAKASWTNKELPGLLTAGTQKYTIQVVAPSGVTPVRAAGCVDGINVQMDGMTEVVVDVNDVPNKFQGDYDLTTHIDLHNDLPGDAGKAIGIIVDLFTDPGSLVLELACENASGLLGQLCNQLVSGGQTTALGQLAANEINELFFDWVEQNTGPNVLVNGQTVAMLLKDMRFRSTLSLNGEPNVPVKDANNTVARMDFPAGTVTEEWKFLGYFWKIGKEPPCAPTDQECGLEWVKMSDIYGSNPTSLVMTAGVIDNNLLEVDKHEVSLLTYGPLMNFLIEKKLLPLIFGDGSNGLPKIDSFQEMILGVMGGPGCLVGSPADQLTNCCESFYNDVSPQLNLTGFLDDLIQPLCVQLVPTVTNELTGLLTPLTGPMSLGTPDGTPCEVSDWNNNLWMDHMGSPTSRCSWDAEFLLTGETFAPDASFYGTKPSDL